jgi:pyruvate,water dikinase
MRKHPDDIETLLQLAETFRKSADQYEIPQPVQNAIIKGFFKLDAEHKGDATGYAVRSSATAEDTTQFSFAGQADSFLCVRDQPRVIEAVKQTWLSLYSPRAILYLNSKGLDFDKIHMSVIIQEMILGDVSGVMFTANVVNQNSNELIIDSTWGLGESIVAGKVTPDSFVLQKTPLQIIQRRLGEKALYSSPFPLTDPERIVLKETPTKKREVFSLTTDKLHELARIGLQIERNMGCPQDIEWTYKNGSFTILQTRPITTL